MSTSGSKSNEHVAHFLVDIHSFVIHHANPYQIYYEEDILEHRDDIIGHYRIS